ncbi:MAG TPA: thiamine pyrophosphate-binding protein [Methylomirabilota bacterium]|nr:thiamine pyrophosphate-binding protein [Methylomirabilota bacterium]
MAGNSPNGAEAMVRLLAGHGVSHIFGLCGDTSLPLYDALARLEHGMEHILCRDERSAAYMADGYARVTGRVGVCEGPSGGGATYILPGVAEANESSVPMVAITSDIATTSRGRFALTELDQEALFRPVAKWNRTIPSGTALPRLVRQAFAEAAGGRPGAVHLGLPYDVQLQAVEEPELGPCPQGDRAPRHRAGPDPRMVRAAAELLGVARAPVIVCGGGVVISGAEAELGALARLLGAPVATSISGQGSVAEDDPLALGVIGSNGGTPETRAVVDAADVVLFVGCRAGSVTTERWRHPRPEGPKIVHLDIDPAAVGANYRADVALIADARLGLAALVDALPAEGPSGRWDGADRVQRAKHEKFARFRGLSYGKAPPVRPERIISELQALLPPDAVLVCDPGTPCPYVSAYYEFRKPGRHFLSNRAHGALGYALSAALGAAIGRPGAPILAIMGDGSFGFTAGELETVTRLGIPLTMLVLSNRSYGWIKAGQRAGYGARYYSVDFSPTDHAAVARAYGIESWRVEAPDDLGPTLKRALASGGPALVDVATQPLHEAAAPVSEWVA